MTEKNNGERDYKSKILHHRLTAVYRIGLAVVIVVAAGILITIQYKRKLFTDYEITSIAAHEKSEQATDIILGNSVLTYSNDGAHCTKSDGTVTWNQTYGINDVLVSVNNGVVAIGNYNGHDIYIANEEKILGEITTAMPIKNLAVAGNGNVTAVLDDAEAIWIDTYDVNGDQLFEGAVHMANSGYPTSLSLSPNGELLGISFTYVNSGEVKTNIAFYNLGEVGKNYSDYIVSAHNYSDLVVPELVFINNDTAFAVGDERLMIYKGAHIPDSAAEYLLDEQIKSVYHSDKYIGLVYYSDDSENAYRCDVYNSQAKLTGSYYFNIDYTDIVFGNDCMTVYNDKECEIIRLDGTVKYEGAFDESVNLMLPVGSSYRYMLVTNNNLEMIQMK